MTERTEATLNNLLGIAKTWGPWATLVFWLLGAIPFVPAPYARSTEEHRLQKDDLSKILTAVRGMCYKLPDRPGRVINCE